MKRYKVTLEVSVPDTLGNLETDYITVENAIKEKLDARYDGLRTEAKEIDAREICEEGI